MYVKQKSGYDQTRCHDHHITNLPFRPVRYCCPYRLYDTLEL